MQRAVIATVLTAALTGAAAAQVPGGVAPNPYSGVIPNFGINGFVTQPVGPVVNPFSAAGSIFNRNSQPLSPYLNMLRGGNPAVNYFYGVRPGLGVGQPLGQNWGNPSVPGMSQLRTGFLPAGANQTQEPTEMPREGAEIPALPPSSHPVTFAGSRAIGSSTPARAGVFGAKPPPPPKR